MNSSYFHTSLGLDFHDGYVAMTLMKKNLSQIGVMDGNYAEMSPLEFSSNPELESQFVQEVQGFLKRKNCRPKFVCLSLPRSLFFFESFEVPVPPERKFLDSMIEFELEKHFSSGLSDFYFGYHLNLLKNNQYRVTASGVKKETATYFLQLVRSLGLTPHLLTAPTMANANMVLAGKSNSSGLTAVVDLGPRSTEVSILKNGLIEFSRSESLMDQSFAQAYFLEMEDDELVRTRSFVIAKEIVASIEEGLARSKNVDELESLNQIFLLGGGGLTEQVAKYLQKESGVPTIFSSIPSEIDSHFPGEYRLSYLNTSLGLASHPFLENALHVDLLPSSLKPKAKKNWLWWSFGFFSVGIASLFGHSGISNSVK